MEPEWNKIIREKIEVEENQRAEFNRERVWASLEVTQPRQSKSRWYYYAAAAVVLVLMGIGFFYPSNPSQKQFVQQKHVRQPISKPHLSNKKEESVSIDLVAPTKTKTEKAGNNKPKSVTITVKKNLPEILPEEKINQTETPKLAEETESVKVAKAKGLRRKIEPIVGFVPDETFTTQVAKPRAMIRVEYARGTEKETYAKADEPKLFKTRIN